MNHERVKEIFLEACDLPIEDRATFLNDACGDDADMRDMVEALLAEDAAPRIDADEGVHAVLGEILDDRGALSVEELDQVDRYQILDELGSGGMGVVYLAEQDSPRRKVALKVLRSGLESTEHQLRLRREAETLGRLQHPGIAQVYDAGVAQGPRGDLPFIVMEYIEGEPLIQYAERHGLSTTARLELFVEICDAIHHAHQKGVIHRDLKPDNILVKERSTTTRQGSSSHVGRPVVLDFGIARITEGDLAHTTMETEAGTLIGTLPYMSPEQITGQSELLDTRTDIYSLGVILFQLLANQLPIDLTGASIPQAILRVRDDEPRRLGTVNRSFSGDLETIASRALEKEPGNRYASASELGGDVGRFLAHEPIVARPPSSMYQLAKFVRRNKGLASGMAATFLALAIGFIVSTVLFFKANEATEKANAATTMAQEATKAAKNSAAEAEAASLEATNKLHEKEAIAQFLTDTVLAARTVADGPQATVVDFLDGAYAMLGNRFEDQPVAHAQMLHTFGTTYLNLAELDKAEELLVRALEMREELYGADHLDTIESRTEVATLYIDRGRGPEAEDLFRQVLEAYQAKLEPDDPNILGILHRLANVIDDDPNRQEEALVIYADLVKRYEQGPGIEEAMTTILNQGVVLRRLGRMDEAEESYRRVIDVAEQSPEEHAHSLISAYDKLGVMQRHADRHEEAEESLLTALDYSIRHVGEDRESTLMTRAQLGTLFHDQRRYEEALEQLDAAAQGLRDLYGVKHRRLVVTQSIQLAVLNGLNRFEEAIPLGEELVANGREVFGPRHWYLAAFLRDLGNSLKGAGRLDEAEAAYNEGYEVASATTGPDEGTAQQLLAYLIDLAKRRGDAEAEAHWRALQK